MAPRPHRRPARAPAALVLGNPLPPGRPGGPPPPAPFPRSQPGKLAPGGASAAKAPAAGRSVPSMLPGSSARGRLPPTLPRWVPTLFTGGASAGVSVLPGDQPALPPGVQARPGGAFCLPPSPPGSRRLTRRVYTVRGCGPLARFAAPTCPGLACHPFAGQVRGAFHLELLEPAAYARGSDPATCVRVTRPATRRRAPLAGNRAPAGPFTPGHRAAPWWCGRFEPNLSPQPPNTPRKSSVCTTTENH